MKLEDARNHVGKLVMSRSAGTKCITKLSDYHGPYTLVQVTKAGLAILDGDLDDRVLPRDLEVYHE